MKKRIINILKVFLIIILSFVLVINIYIILQTKAKPNSVPSIFGYKPFIVLSGSMKPQFDVGDLIIVEKANSDSLKKGDVIAFRDKKNFVTTHRITNVVNKHNETCFETNGDNNNTKDESIVCKNKIEGKYHSKITKAGNFVLFIQKPVGFTVMMLTIVVIGLIIYLVESKKSNKELILKNEEEKKEFEEFKKQKEKNKK